MEKLKPSELQNRFLLAEYDYLIKKSHYDPVDSMESDYTLSELENEIKFRMTSGGFK